MNKPLSILQVNTLDVGGGAEQIAGNLLQHYQDAGHKAWLAVGEKRANHPQVIAIPQVKEGGIWAGLCMKLRSLLEPLDGKLRGIARLRKNLADLSIGADVIPRWLAMEEFHYPGSKTILDLPHDAVDIVHLHNLHGHYFDLRTLSQMSKKVPIVITMHDAWLLSGNCAHSFACTKWQSGCGLCPDITLYPGLSHDTTALNWRRKQGIYAHSKIYLATPSRWLMDKALQSILAPAIMQSKVIPNGVDLTIFKPADQISTRERLGIASDVKVILFAANGIKRNPFKDYATIFAAIAELAKKDLAKTSTSTILVIALGEAGEDEMVGNIPIRYVPPITNRLEVATYYQASDVYVHASHEDTFPTSILEAMACGLPVVATAVGGIPEQVDNGFTGTLVGPGDSAAMARAIENILINTQLRQQMGKAAIAKAKAHFSSDLQSQRYLKWFEEIRQTKTSSFEM